MAFIHSPNATMPRDLNSAQDNNKMRQFSINSVWKTISPSVLRNPASTPRRALEPVGLVLVPGMETMRVSCQPTVSVPLVSRALPLGRLTQTIPVAKRTASHSRLRNRAAAQGRPSPVQTVSPWRSCPPSNRLDVALPNGCCWKQEDLVPGCLESPRPVSLSLDVSAKSIGPPRDTVPSPMENICPARPIPTAPATPRSSRHQGDQRRPPDVPPQGRLLQPAAAGPWTCRPAARRRMKNQRHRGCAYREGTAAEGRPCRVARRTKPAGPGTAATAEPVREGCCGRYTGGRAG